MDDFLKSLTNMLVGAGIKGYGAIADRSQMPANKRLYLETFADNQTTPITEKSFNMDELQRIGEIIKAKQLANPNAQDGYIQYKDYANFIKPSEVSGVAGVSSGERNPYENIRTTLGQFNYAIDPKTGNVSVKDTYDFNPMQNKSYQRQSRGDYVVNMLDPLTIARAYGEAKMPSGSGKGRPVSIQLPAGLLGR
jgi:hypothetical protein